MRQRFPHSHQHNAMDCGPACLRMVAQSYGKHYRLETLRERCFITREGVSMLGIADAAETIGFRTLGVKTTVKELTSERPLPCILHWNQNHFVVLYDIRKQWRTGALTFCIADPASQESKAIMISSWSSPAISVKALACTKSVVLLWYELSIKHCK